MRYVLLLRSCLLYCYFLWRGDDQQRRLCLETSVASLGGVYVKMMQFLTLRTELFSSEDKLAFLAFFDHVPVQPVDIARVLVSELSPTAVATFASFEKTPFASGTFGQVYHATLTSGQTVVIKVKRQNLKVGLFFDFLVMKMLARMSAWLLDPKIVDTRRLVSEFAEITWQELDYRKEVANALALYTFYRNHPVVVIPFTYAELSTKNILVQDFVPGLAVTELLRDSLQLGRRDNWLLETYQTDLRFINKYISYTLLQQSFVLDRFYSDPHPGNIKILPNNQFAFIDFGIMASSPPNRRSYYQILKTLVASSDSIDTEQLSRSFFEFTAAELLQSLEICDEHNLTSSALTPQILAKYEKKIKSNPELLTKFIQTKKGDYAFIWQELLHLGEQFGMQFPPGMFAALRSAMLIKSFTSLLQPDVFVMKDVYQEVTDQVDPSTFTGHPQHTVNDIDPESAFERVAVWLTNLVEKDVVLYRKLMQPGS